MPLVSVVLPVRTAAATIDRAIASIRRQTFPDWELIVVDDGSADDCAGRVRAIAAAEPRIRLVEQRHAGVVDALNCALGLARGELIARMDADDESHPERLAEQVALLAARPEVGLASCLVDFGGDRRVSAGYALHVDWINSLIAPAEIALNRFIESPLAHPSVMFRRALIERWGGYRAGDFPEDYELWLRWLEAGVAMAKVPRALLTWHDTPSRLSRVDPRYAVEKFFQVKAAYLAREATRRRLGRRLLVWGAGRPTRKRAAYLGLPIDGYVDIDPRKIGRTIAGRPVMAPAALPSASSVFVLAYVANRDARTLIRQELARHSFEEGRDFLSCA